MSDRWSANAWLTMAANAHTNMETDEEGYSLSTSGLYTMPSPYFSPLPFLLSRITTIATIATTSTIIT